MFTGNPPDFASIKRCKITNSHDACYDSYELKRNKCFKNCFFYIYILKKNGEGGGGEGVSCTSVVRKYMLYDSCILIPNQIFVYMRDFKEAFSVFAICSSEIADVKLLCPDRYRLLTVKFQICLIDRTFLIVNFTFLDCNITLYIISRIYCRMSVTVDSCFISDLSTTPVFEYLYSRD